MSKYFKFHQVDSETGISIEIEPSVNGPTHPEIDGRKVIFESNDFYYATVSDSAEEDPDNYIFEISADEFKLEIEKEVTKIKNRHIENLYGSEKSLREQILGDYHETASIAGVYKYEEAKELLDNGVSSQLIDMEASLRGITSEEMAQKIVDNHIKFRENDAKISGLRGKLVDRVNSFVLDEDNIVESYLYLTRASETIVGDEDDPFAMDNISDSYYLPNLILRWTHM